MNPKTFALAILVAGGGCIPDMSGVLAQQNERIDQLEARLKGESEEHRAEVARREHAELRLKQYLAGDPQVKEEAARAEAEAKAEAEKKAAQEQTPSRRYYASNGPLPLPTSARMMRPSPAEMRPAYPEVVAMGIDAPPPGWDTNRANRGTLVVRNGDYFSAVAVGGVFPLPMAGLRRIIPAEDLEGWDQATPVAPPTGPLGYHKYFFVFSHPIARPVEIQVWKIVRTAYVGSYSVLQTFNVKMQDGDGNAYGQIDLTDPYR
ncbi:MAG TPA: hypothetical protein VFQ60_04990 [Patescibacteria group bacterium]|nr:hypothetical protein [Patescibacteria group bacterium]